MKNTVNNGHAGKVPPHCIEAEDSILGLCIYDGTETFVKAAQYITTSEIFHIDDNRLIWETMTAMYTTGIPIDIILLTRELNKVRPTQCGNTWAYVTAKKTDLNVTRAHLTNWCLAIVEDYVSRLSTSAVYDLHGKDPFTVAADLDAKLKSAMNFKIVDDWSDMSQMALQLDERREQIRQGKQFGVLTGYRELDAITGGIEPGLVVIGARPSMGKTAFACSLLLNMARLGTPVGIISLEMPNVQLAGRFASIVSGVEFWRVYRSKEADASQQEAVVKSLSTMSTLPVYSTDSSRVNISDIRWKVEKLVRTKGARCIIVDYIQLVNTDGSRNETREREVAKLSAGLKAISKDLDIVVIALAQLNRESETPDKVSRMGKLSQLRESDAILADADMGIIVDRPYKRGELTDEHGASTENIGRINIEKHRNGETKLIELHFDTGSMHFMDKPVTHYPVLPDMIDYQRPIKRGYDELPPF